MFQPSFRLPIVSVLVVALLLAGIPVAQAAPGRLATQQAPALWNAAAIHNDIAYFAFGVPRRIERFQLSTATWLSPINLPRDYILVEDAPSAITVDDDGIFIAFRLAIYRMELDGSGAIALPNNPVNVTGLHTTAQHIYAVSSRVITSISKTTNARVGSREYFYSLGGTAIAPERNRIYGRSLGVSPADIHQVAIDAQGALGAMSDSPYHGDYASGSRVFVFPDEARVTDTSGTVYNAGNLTYSGSFGGAVESLAFIEDLPLVLRGKSLIAFTSNLLETSRYTLEHTGNLLAVTDETVYVFRAGGDRGVLIETAPLASFGPLQPGAPVDARGLAYSPDRVEISPNGIVYLLSRSNRAIFRWSLAERAYLPSIPLREAPERMAYAPGSNRLYLSYTGGAITQIRLNEGVAETPFVNAPKSPCGLAVAGANVFICNPTGTWSTYITYSPEGALLSSKDLSYSSNDYVWSAANQRMYYLRDRTSPNDLHATQINAAGVIGATTETPYHSSEGINHPIRVSPDGSAVVLGSGRVFDAIALTNANQLSNAITDAAWGSSLFTVRTLNGATQLQRWTAGYTLDAVADLPGTPLRLFSAEDQLLAIVNRSGVPQFVLLDESFNQIYASALDQKISGLRANGGGTVQLGGAFQFSAAVTAGDGITYAWDFGDGQTAEGATVTHTYAEVGVYTVKLTARNAVSEQSLSLTAEVVAPPVPTLYVAPSALAFQAVVGEPDPPAQRIAVSHNGPASIGWAVAEAPPWLTLSQTSGAIPGALDVQPQIADLEPGNYSGTIRIRLDDPRVAPKEVQVALRVSAEPPPPAFSVTPGSLGFTAVVGSAETAPKTLNISHTGSADVAWSATSDQAWLRVSPGDGLGPAAITVQALPAGLTPGAYTGVVSVRLSDPRVPPQSIPVTFIVAADETPQMSLSAQPGVSGIMLTWTPPRLIGAASYRVLRGAAEGELSALTTTRNTHFADNDPDLEAKTVYCYRVEALRANGSVLAQSPLACAVFGQLALWAPDVWGAPGSLAVIPVNISNADGLRIAAADIWLELDSRVAEPVRVSATPLSSGYTWSYSVSGRGANTLVRIAALTNTNRPLAGSGSLFWLVVRVKGDPDSSTPLNLREYIAGVGGSTIYTPDKLDAPVPMLLQSGTFRVRAAYSLGDLNGNGTVEAVDAYIALQIAAGRITPTAQQRAAGDVNGNGVVDAADATLILGYAARGAWNMIEPTPAAISAQGGAGADATPVRLSLSPVNGRAGDRVTTTLATTALSELAGGRMVLTYDPALVEAIESVQLHANAAAFALQYHDDEEGVLTIALADDAAHTLDGALLNITFTLGAQAQEAGQIVLALADAHLHDIYGRDFATSALVRTVERSDSTLNPAYRVYLPLLRR